MSDHPYVKYQNTALWKTVEKAIGELVENTDIIEQTKREYIVGYLCKVISKKILKSDELEKAIANRMPKR